MSGGKLVVLDQLGRNSKQWALPDGLATVGSDPNCHVRIMDSSVSAHHATIVVHNNQTVVHNVSESETKVNGAPVSVAALQHGDVISIAGHCLRWEYSDPCLPRLDPLSPQPVLYARGRRSRGGRVGGARLRHTLEGGGTSRDSHVRHALHMSQRASMPAKQVAIVQPQRRDTNNQNGASGSWSSPRLVVKPHRSYSQSTRSRSSGEEPARRSSPKTTPNLHNTTKATLWIESRKNTPRKSAKLVTPPARAPASRKAVTSVKKSTPLRMVVLRKTFTPNIGNTLSAGKTKVAKIAAPSTIDYTKQAAIMLMTGHTPKSKVSTPKGGIKVPTITITSPDSVKNTPIRGRTKDRRVKGSKSPNVSVTPKGVSAYESDSSLRNNSGTLYSTIDITDSSIKSSSKRSTKSTAHSPQLASPKKSAMKDPSGIRSTRKTESIKFDLSNLENNDSNETFITDASSTNSVHALSVTEDDMNLQYSDTSKSPSPRRSIHTRRSKILARTSPMPVDGSPGLSMMTCNSSSDEVLNSASSRKSFHKGNMIIQKALQNTGDSENRSSRYSSRTTKSAGNRSESDIGASMTKTRTSSPRSPKKNLETYSIVDLVSIDSNDSEKSTVYNSAGSVSANSSSTTFGSPQTRRKTKLSPSLLVTSTPYVGKVRASERTQQSPNLSTRIMRISTRSSPVLSKTSLASLGRSKSLISLKNQKDVTANTTRGSRASSLLMYSLSATTPQNQKYDESINKSNLISSSPLNTSTLTQKMGHESINSTKTSRVSSSFRKSMSLTTPDNPISVSGKTTRKSRASLSRFSTVPHESINSTRVSVSSTMTDLTPSSTSRHHKRVSVNSSQISKSSSLKSITTALDPTHETIDSFEVSRPYSSLRRSKSLTTTHNVKDVSLNRSKADQLRRSKSATTPQNRKSIKNTRISQGRNSISRINNSDSVLVSKFSALPYKSKSTRVSASSTLTDSTPLSTPLNPKHVSAHSTRISRASSSNAMTTPLDLTHESINSSKAFKPYSSLRRSKSLITHNVKDLSSNRSKTSSTLRRSKSVTTPQNPKYIKSTKLSRASKSRSRINDSDSILVDLELGERYGDEEASPKSSRRFSRSNKSGHKTSKNTSLLSTQENISIKSDGATTPDNAISVQDISTPMLSIQRLLDSSQNSFTSEKSVKKKRISEIPRRKTVGQAFGHSGTRKSRTVTKSKSLNLSVRRTILRLSKESSVGSEKTDENAQQTENDDTITPKSSVKIIQEPLKNKHSTAKKPQSKRNLIDNLNDSDIVKQLFNSPVKRKLSQSMTEFSRKQLFNDEVEATVNKRSRKTIAVSGKTSDDSLPDTETTEAYDPEVFVSPLSTPSNSPNLTGIKRLFQKSTTKKSIRISPSTSNKKSSPRNDLTVVSGVKSVFRRSPRNRLSDIRGVKELFAPSPKNDLRKISGVKPMFQSYTKRKSVKNDLNDVRGVRKLFKEQKSPRDDLENISGVKDILHINNPKNDLSDVRGLRRLFRTDKQQGDLTDFSGVEQLFNSSHNSKVSDTDILFDELLGKQPIKKVYSKSLINKTAPKKKRNRKMKTLHDSVDVNNVLEWLQKERVTKSPFDNKSENVLKVNRELNKLKTNSVSGTTPIVRGKRSRIPQSDIDGPEVGKSVSEVYSARKLPIKKRSLVRSLLKNSYNDSKSSNLPIKKRVLTHSTPLKNTLSMTANVSELGRVSPITAPVDCTYDINQDTVTRLVQISPKNKRKITIEVPFKSNSSIKRTRSKKTQSSVHISPVQTRSRRSTMATNNTNITNTKKHKTSLVIMKKTPLLSPQPAPKKMKGQKENVTPIELHKSNTNKKAEATPMANVQKLNTKPNPRARQHGKKNSESIVESPKINLKKRVTRGQKLNSDVNIKHNTPKTIHVKVAVKKTSPKLQVARTRRKKDEIEAVVVQTQLKKGRKTKVEKEVENKPTSHIQSPVIAKRSRRTVAILEDKNKIHSTKKKSTEVTAKPKKEQEPVPLANVNETKNRGRQIKNSDEVSKTESQKETALKKKAVTKKVQFMDDNIAMTASKGRTRRQVACSETVESIGKGQKLKKSTKETIGDSVSKARKRKTVNVVVSPKVAKTQTTRSSRSRKTEVSIEQEVTKKSEKVMGRKQMSVGVEVSRVTRKKLEDETVVTPNNMNKDVETAPQTTRGRKRKSDSSPNKRGKKRATSALVTSPATVPAAAGTTRDTRGMRSLKQEKMPARPKQASGRGKVAPASSAPRASSPAPVSARGRSTRQKLAQDISEQSTATAVSTRTRRR